MLMKVPLERVLRVVRCDIADVMRCLLLAPSLSADRPTDDRRELCQDGETLRWQANEAQQDPDWRQYVEHQRPHSRMCAQEHSKEPVSPRRIGTHVTSSCESLRLAGGRRGCRTDGCPS